MGVSPIAPGNSQVKTASNEDGVIRRVTALSPATGVAGLNAFVRLPLQNQRRLRARQ